MPAVTTSARGGEASEAILDPDLPIIDAHHHLWFQPQAVLDALDHEDPELGPLAQNYTTLPRYLLDELMADALSGHDVRASVYVATHSMTRRTGPEHLRSVGEVEFAAGMAAMAESGTFGEPRLCAAIIGAADLRCGRATEETLDAQMAAAGGRYRGIRAAGVGYDPRLPRLSKALGSAPNTLAEPAFREGVAALERRGLSCDIFLFEPQLPDLGPLARAFPDVQFVLNHVGMPVRLPGAGGSLPERYADWRREISEAGRHPNITVKLGGLGNAMCGFSNAGRHATMGSEELAEAWRPYIEPCIEAFGPSRAMFESNFPVDGVTARYPIIWNAFKRIASGASPSERAALFAGTAKRVYQLDVDVEGVGATA